MTIEVQEKPSKNGRKKQKLPVAKQEITPPIELRALLDEQETKKTGGIFTIIETTSGTFSGFRTNKPLPSDYEYWFKGDKTIYWVMVPGLDSIQANELLLALSKNSLGEGTLDDLPTEIIEKQIAPLPLPQTGHYGRTAAQLYAFVSTYRGILIEAELEGLKREDRTPLERFKEIGGIVGPMILILVLTFVMVVASTGD